MVLSHWLLRIGTVVSGFGGIALIWKKTIKYIALSCLSGSGSCHGLRHAVSSAKY